MSVWVLGVILTWAAADDGPLDDIGCHQNTERTEYHCHAGPLAGARYASRAAAERALAAREHQQTPRRSGDDPLTVVLWTFDATPTDAERVAAVLADADLAVLRGPGGKAQDAFLTKVNANLDARTHRRHCHGQRGGQAFVWREGDVLAVKSDGALLEACAARGYDLNSAGAVVFGSRAAKRFFTVGASTEGWPGLVYDQTFPSANKLGFRSALKAKPAAVWTRGVFVLDAKASALGERYGELNPRELEQKVGRHAPATLRFSFTEPSVDTLEMVKRVPSPGRQIASEPAYEAYPSLDSNNLSVPEDDLESEERASRPTTPAKVKKPRKRR